MTFAGHLHPLLVHFPIGLVLMAAVAEAIATVTGSDRWRMVAVLNIRAGALFAAATVVTGYLFAASMAPDEATALEWHRWLGIAGAAVTFAAALGSVRQAHGSAGTRWMYRLALFGGAALIAFAGHLGGLLVWGADFLRR
jgi:uncharacterized membrane protein